MVASAGPFLTRPHFYANTLATVQLEVFDNKLLILEKIFDAP